MKKLIALLLAAVMLLSLAACGGESSSAAEDTETQETAAEPEPEQTEAEETAEPEQEAVMLSVGDTIDNENFTMTFDSMEILDEYSYKTSEYSSTSLYVEDGYKLLLLKGHMENNSTAVISDSSFARTVVVNGTYTVTDYDVRLSFKRDKYFEIDPYTDQDYFLYINIPEKLAAQFETAAFTLGFNDDMSVPVTEWKSDGTSVTPTDNLYTVTGGTASEAAEEAAMEAEIAAMEEAAGETGSTASDAAEEAAALEAEIAAMEEAAGETAGTADSAVKTIALGDVIETEDFDFTLNNVELTYELKPQNTNGVYSSYTAEDGKVYIHVDGSYYNKAKRDICIRDLFAPSADYDNGYAYTGFVVTDDGDNNFTWASSRVVCTPLETCHYHGLIECPKVIDGSDASLIVYLEIAGTTYQYTVR